MNVQLYILSIVECLIFIVLAGCTGTGNPTPSAPSAMDLKVVAQRNVQIDGKSISHPSSLSPDGKWVAALGDQHQLCIYSVDTLTEKLCTESKIGPVASVFAWSPDSRRVALTDDWRSDFESNVWWLDIESGQLTQLTTDNNVENMFPVWSPNGQSLLFQHSTSTGPVMLYRIAISGGTPERVFQSFDPSFLTSPVIWLANDQILYTTPRNGMQIVGADGQNARQVLGFDSQLGPPSLMAVSAAGDTGLVIYSLVGRKEIYSRPNTSYCAIVNLSTGETKPLKQATGSATEFYGPMDATYSPDGSKILYIYMTAGNKAQLVVRDVSGGPENLLFTADAPEFFTSPGQHLTWAKNDVIYLPFARLLLTVGTK